MNKNSSQIYQAAIYLRLSREDDDVAEAGKLASNSISNQKALIMDFLKSHTEIQVHSVYADDGYSGVRFDCPNFQRMLEEIRKGTVNCVIVHRKNLSDAGSPFYCSNRSLRQHHSREQRRGGYDDTV